MCPSSFQEMRQHCGGISILRRVIESLGGAKKITVLVDMFGHDAWPALSCLEAPTSCPCVCATAAHTDVEHKYVKAMTMTGLVHEDLTSSN